MAIIDEIFKELGIIYFINNRELAEQLSERLDSCFKIETVPQKLVGLTTKQVEDYVELLLEQQQIINGFKCH